jgi:hypothetical protein
MRLIAFLPAAVPVVFALVRALRTGHDLRYVWMALAAIVATALVMKVGGARRRGPAAVMALTAAAAIASAALATLVAIVLGATAGAGIAVVSVVFGVCCAASGALDAFSAGA